MNSLGTGSVTVVDPLWGEGRIAETVAAGESGEGGFGQRGHELSGIRRVGKMMFLIAARALRGMMMISGICVREDGA
jgi:hypothetical protein